MQQLISPRDRTLTPVTLVLGIVIWCGAIYALVAAGGAKSLYGLAFTVLIVAAISFIAYVFARSAAIAQLKGNGIELSECQFPELYAQFVHCCDTLAVQERPGIYLLNGNGVLNAFATWFLGTQYVVLNSSVVDAMDSNPSGIRFYAGHELGHVLRHDNPVLWILRWPALRLPLIGASFPVRAKAAATCMG